jgi:catechol 2,3-dioxygenase-like lactoylglutathione lyase family enzyme
MYLDHATIVTPNLDLVRRFFVDVVGLADGTRPPFSVDGHWIYANGKPVIHLIDATVPAETGFASPRIDHFALRIENADEWLRLVERLQAAQVQYQLAEVPLAGELQLFVALAPGVHIEFVIARRLTHR